jgi:uncharacterized protein
MNSRVEALELVRKHVQKENSIKHMIAVGAVMRAVAVRLNENLERWEVTGILHDIDIEECTGMADHTLKAQVILAGRVDGELIDVIMAHNTEASGVPVDSRFKIALIASDAVSGLVTACALVMPSKKIADVQVSSVIKKFGNKDFAKGVSRERILMCQELGIARDDFLALSLDGMRKVSDELGL